MDALVALATSAAFLYSLYGTYHISLGHAHHAHQLYFESVAVILTLITLGKYFETLSKGRTSEAIKKLMHLSAKEATVLVMVRKSSFLWIRLFLVTILWSNLGKR